MQKTAILGIGNRLKGDDAIGSLIAAELEPDENTLVLDCEDVPENFRQKVIDFKPEKIILIDAVDFGAEPGTVRTFELGDETKTTTSTHKISLHTLASMLRKETNARVLLVGIQPKSVEFGAEICEEVLAVKNHLTTNLLSL